MNELKEKIRRLCTDAGFSNARFSRAGILKEEAKYLRQWLDENRHGGMSWMDSSYGKRTDPAAVMSDAKTVISLSYNYDTPYEHSQSQDVPKISRYAWGTRDYHKILKGKLRKLCADIERISEAINCRYYTDDGPVMDKAWAVRSGLGWMGKNTNVIDKDSGSFFFIATILMNAEIEPDRAVEDLCRECTLCVSACPTGAIYDEYKVDSNLCISYQTIENRSDKITEIDLHGWIFGCDICQDVCPFNRPGTFSTDEHFIPNRLVFNKTYDELLQMSESGFKETFAGTPVMRAKYAGWMRNLRKARSELKR
ncbi:MAG: tRNA epoxyqueuosine(34) reductase QueG [Ignavibacteria bacterium]|nr:tRNA epoxyqueuosine(34) reductase QueG [Ignavibacteria bacterium]